MNEFWKKNKKNICVCLIVVLLCGISFTCGRCIRLRRAESNSKGIEQSIGRIESSTDTIENGLNTIGSTGGLISERTDYAIDQLNYATLRAAELETLINECRTTFADSQKEFSIRLRGIESAIGTTDYILQVAELKAEKDERTLARLAELLGISDESADKQ